MSYDPTRQAQPAYTTAPAIDAGLQSFMHSVYSTMSWGLMLTGLTAYGVANTGLFALLFHNAIVGMLIFLAPLLFISIAFRPSRIAVMSAQQMKLTFSLFSVLIGLSFSAIFLTYTGASIARVFFITAATFASMSIYGYTTRRDLTAMGSFMMMGLTGLIIAMLINLFMGSAMLSFVTSALGVLIFTGLTAWETQSLKNVYRSGAGEANDKIAVYGALSLYLKFINLFQFLLAFLGDRR